MTARQREVAALVAEGHSIKTIARSLGLSPHTVSQHVRSIYAALEIHDRVSLARFMLGVTYNSKSCFGDPTSKETGAVLGSSPIEGSVV